MMGAHDDQQCRRWLLSGRVQGVGFRWFVCTTAGGMGLDGTVRNLPDGRVEVVARGSGAQLDQFEDRLRQGPPSARVAEVRREPAELTPRMRGFQVVH